MSRYIGPKLRIIRRLGKLLGLTRKKPINRLFSMPKPFLAKQEQESQLLPLRPALRSGEDRRREQRSPFGIAERSALRRQNKQFSFGSEGNNNNILVVKPPGQHGSNSLLKKGKNDASKHLISLKIKQRIKFYYGLTEKQLINNILLLSSTFYLKELPKRSFGKEKEINLTKGDLLLQRLEMRLDNVIYRLAMAPTVLAARQLIMHGHVKVNNNSRNTPSYICKPLDIISVNNKEKSLNLINKSISGTLNVVSTLKDLQ